MVLAVPVSSRQIATPGAPSPTAGTPSAGTPIAATPGTLAAVGYSDVTVTGMYAGTTLFLPAPSSVREIESGELRLNYSHSPLLVPELSTLTVSVGGQALASARLTPETQSGGQLVVALPAVEVSGGTIPVQVSFYLRLTTDTCEVVDNPAQWATIHATSAYDVTGAAGTALLSDLPSLFLSREQGPTAPPRLIVPSAPDGTTLAAAGTAAYAWGRWAGAAYQDADLVSGVGDTELPSDQPAMLVGPGADLPLGEGWGPLAWDGAAFTLDGQPVPDGAGVIALRDGPTPQLLVSGTTPDAVRLAANRLVEVAGTPGQDGFDVQAVMVTAGGPVAPEPARAWESGAASFQQLGVGIRDVTGTGEHFIDLPFERPAGWDLGNGGTLQLALDISPGIRLETSWVRATVNGIDLGAQALRATDGDVDRYVFVLPGEELTTGLDGQPIRQLDLQIRVFLDLPTETCEAVNPDSVWASLQTDSAWILPATPYSGHDLGRFPAGFVPNHAVPEIERDQPDTDIAPPVIALPDEATPEELGAGMIAAAAFGRWDAFGMPASPVVAMAGALTEDQRSAASVVAIGGPDRNGLLTGVEGTFVVDPPVVPAGSTGGAATLTQMTSPWSDDRELIVVAGNGANGTGVGYGAIALGRAESLIGMQGTQVVVDAGDISQSVAVSDTGNAVPADLAPFVVPEDRTWIERIPVWQVVGVILLVAFIALVVGVVALRWVRVGRRG
jgi:hypothetical protein